MSLADLRANPPVARQEESFRVALRPDLATRIKELTAELADLPDPVVKQRKMVQSEPEVIEHPRAVEIRAEIEAMSSEFDSEFGTLVIRRTKSDGEWRRWADANPPRSEEDNKVAHVRDLRATAGLVNADALMDDLGSYAWSWNGEPLQPGDWEAIFADNVLPGDKIQMAKTVVNFYEASPDFTQWRRLLSDALTKFNVSEQPESSESPSDDSSDGNLELSSED